MLVTDGDDTSTTVTQEQLLGNVKNCSLRVYCFGLVSEDDQSKAPAAKLARRELAEASGGFVGYPRDPADLEAIGPEISHEAWSQ